MVRKFMLKQYFLNQTKRTKQITSVLVVLIVAGVGTYLLVGSHAATPYASITADQGTLANGATKQTCAGASNGNCVVFGGSSGPAQAILGFNGTYGYSTNVSNTILNAVSGNYPFGWERSDFNYTDTGQTTATYFTENHDFTAATNAGHVLGLLDTQTMPVDSTPIGYTGSPGSSPCSVWGTTMTKGTGTVTCSEDYPDWAVSVMKAYPNVKLWEILNEPSDGGKKGPTSAWAYGGVYLATYNAVQSAIKSGKLTGPEKLIFMDTGDWYNGTNWSSDAGGGGYLHDALCANGGTPTTSTSNCPNSDSTNYTSSLAYALENNAISLLPYGGLAAQQDYCNSSGAEDASSPYAID